ncbi:MAG TPA: prepilin-type N-terminal cleavage/methylation domain-containing protein [Candidatus Saccharimonadales bacterium]|nr:prepilin-type N-terminal cleavage/methylation domain-containing protein [Candidatus Saccharimonadales bacterium]
MKKLLTSNTGFTLIELLIVITIIVIVIGVGAVSYTTVARNSRNSQRQSALKKISEALEEYYADHHTYPNTNVSGQFQTVGSDCGKNAYDAICCLLGGTIASVDSSIIPAGSWRCTDPFNTYIAPGEKLATIANRNIYTGLPRDASINPTDDSGTTLTTKYYAYASDGQSYVLTTTNYEGTAPSENRFSSTFSSYYWPKASAWVGSIAWGNQYAVRSPHEH